MALPALSTAATQRDTSERANVLIRDYNGRRTAVPVASLPATPGFGEQWWVNDSNATWTAGIGAVVAGGGANTVPVRWTGADWRIG